MNPGNMNLEALLDFLLEEGPDGRTRRVAFYEQPVEFVNTHAPGLPAADRAILFSMDRRLIGAHVPRKSAAVDLHRFSGHWPAQGQDWPAPPDSEFDPAPSLPSSGSASTRDSAGMDLVQAGGGGSAWGDPGPHGRGFEPDRCTVGTAGVKFTLVGEGFLDTATVSFEHVDPSAENGGPFFATLFGVGVVYRNFRRCYLRCTIDIGASWTPGPYVITVQNDPENPDTFIRAGHFLKVKPKPTPTSTKSGARKTSGSRKKSGARKTSGSRKKSASKKSGAKKKKTAKKSASKKRKKTARKKRK